VGYDGSIFALILPYLARDFRVAPTALAGPLALLQLAALLAIPFNRWADRRGRRGLLIGTALGYALANLASGLSPDLATFITTRLAAKLLSSVEVGLAFVMVSEELPPAARGTGLSVMSVVGGVGSGVVVLLFPLAGAPFAWRWLYLVSLPALAVVVLLRWRLGETQRFLDSTRGGEPLRVLWHAAYRQRALLLGLFFLVTTLPAPAVTFLSTYALDELGLRPAALTALILVAGATGLAGYLIGGYAADRYGRRGVMVATTAGLSLAVLVLYGGTQQGLWLGATAGAFLAALGAPAFTAYVNELFPTSARATANAWIGACAVIGSLGGLLWVSAFAGPAGGLRLSILWLAAPPLAALGIIPFLPETAGKELEQLAPEPA
jgi:MFS family permease